MFKLYLTGVIFKTRLKMLLLLENCREPYKLFQQLILI